MSLFIMHKGINVRVPDAVQADGSEAMTTFMEKYQEGPEALAVFMEQYAPEPPEVEEDDEGSDIWTELDETEVPTEGDDAT